MRVLRVVRVRCARAGSAGLRSNESARGGATYRRRAGENKKKERLSEENRSLCVSVRLQQHLNERNHEPDEQDPAYARAHASASYARRGD